MTDTTPDFLALIDALARTENPSAPRNVREHFVHLGLAALRGWQGASVQPTHKVPLHELVELRRRCRELERELAEARGQRTVSLNPSPRRR